MTSKKKSSFGGDKMKKLNVKGGEYGAKPAETVSAKSD